MNKFRVLINCFCWILAVLPFVYFLSVFFVAKTNQLLCFPAITAIPDGFYNYVSDYDKNNYIEFPIFVGLDNESDFLKNENEQKVNVKDSVSVAVDNAVLGNIVKKTLTPYSSNKVAKAIYLNNSAGVDINVPKLLSEPLNYTVKPKNEPQILIYHTHTTEAYMDSEDEYYKNTDEPRTTDNTKNIVAIGEMVAVQLEKAGFSVIHDKALHDYPGFSGSYARSAETVKANLQKYPTIKVVIDIHRDSIASGEKDKVAPVVNINGKEAAQVMLVMGSQSGTITDHPNWQENLKLALKLQYLFENTYPQFARTMLLRSTKYNQNLSTGAFLIEIGSDANTFEQAIYSAELVGKTLSNFLLSQ